MEATTNLGFCMRCMHFFSLSVSNSCVDFHFNNSRMCCHCGRRLISSVARLISAKKPSLQSLSIADIWLANLYKKFTAPPRELSYVILPQSAIRPCQLGKHSPILQLQSLEPCKLSVCFIPSQFFAIPCRQSQQISFHPSMPEPGGNSKDSAFKM